MIVTVKKPSPCVLPCCGLSRWSISGEKACPTCGDDTDSLRLKHGKKFAFMGHKRWLPMSHRFGKGARASGRKRGSNDDGHVHGKTKDVIRARANLVELGIRHDLHPRADGAHTKLPAVEYNMKPREKIMLCQVFLPIAIQKVLPKSVVIML
ncbi:hypothetical protein ACFX1R_043105 [Malus domestica]